MKRLEMIKGAQVAIPAKEKRYLVVWWSGQDWYNSAMMHTTPEGAVGNFLKYKNTTAQYYTVVEVELPIPIAEGFEIV